MDLHHGRLCIPFDTSILHLGVWASVDLMSDAILSTATSHYNGSWL